jgi:glycosyltransferase involved in cell wall biosynthesis
MIYNIKLTALIITLNEEAQMHQLLTDLNFADEIIVVDSFSNDKTEEIATSFKNVKFLQNKFENFSSQRNFAVSQAKNDWILFLDADERLTPELKNEILETLKANRKEIAFLFPRTFMFKNRVLLFSGCQTDKIFRLFNKNFAKYSSEKLIHEKLITKGEIATFKNKLIHYSYFDFESYKSKMVHYGKLKAEEKFIKKQKNSLLLQILHPAYDYLYNYCIRLGFLDGKKGIIICYLRAYSIFIRHQELRNLWKKNNAYFQKISFFFILLFLQNFS